MNHVASVSNASEPSNDEFDPPLHALVDDALPQRPDNALPEFSSSISPSQSKISPSIHVLKGGKPKFVSRADAQTFRKRWFPTASKEQWNDWRWQIRNRIRQIDVLASMITLSQDEHDALTRQQGHLPLSITPYYASLLDSHDPAQPLRRTVIPVRAEYTCMPGEADDPLGEDHTSPVPGIVHRYPDRVLFLATDFCSTYCRYCTRSRMVGEARSQHSPLRQWEQAIAYIAANPAIRDVLISGGDPLTLADDRLEWLLARLRRIPHVELLRIGTKVPAVLPQRITPTLTRMFKRYHPLWMSLHFTHPDELTPETAQASQRLADAGIPLGSQTVLLAGINDTVDTMKRLVQGLVKIRVRPYYLYQCDPITGSSHFRTPVAKGLEIIRGLRGYTTGYAVPTYVIDAPGGGGKIPLLPDHVVGQEGEDLLLKNYEGKTSRYPDAWHV
ncbi:KamA family radical SAM protein [candidate division KSB3 bacterium]|uniref:L-lysine 2,3-aminomutase n=1 Tax=candidate division KSB3 bacterium TaxID=2044937 RepID=A0A9D5JS53_9BACT|nr:KamA family radical SAM protein [candidate division KSB3 bacterium]MBD3322999.1 KamA family radical SAM protein [candidate division KSB3 bacterium]